jgi:pimeloyl-ACP methyl ester carboxylesterase
MFRPYSDSDSDDETSIRLPRILCLHGGGTNSRIFRIQTRILRQLLRSHFRFVFVEAPYISRPAQDVAAVFGEMGPFKTWIGWREEDHVNNHADAASRIIEAIENAMVEDDMRGAQGEWVGILGFSQGAKLAASLLYFQQHRSEVMGKEVYWPDFRFGILLNGSAPLVWLDAEEAIPVGLVDAATLSSATHPSLAPIPHEHRLRIPTLHVHGLLDPGIGNHRKLLHGCCDLRYARLFEWEGGHRVPVRSTDCKALSEQILALARSTYSVVFPS